MNLPKFPHSAMFVGVTACGKTEFLLQLLETIYKSHFEFIVILCPTILDNKTYLSRKWIFDDKNVFIVCDIKGNLNEWIKLFKNALKGQILDQLTNLGRDVDSEFPKPKRGRKKKADPKINELEDNDVRDKRERLVACVLSGNSKMYLGKEYTEEQINKMDCNDVNTLLNRYESVLSTQMTKSLGKSVINLYSNIACSVLGIGNQQELSTDLECDPFLNTAMQRFTCDLYYRFGALLAPVSVGIITGKHYAKNSITILNDRTSDPAKSRDCNQTEPSEN